MQNPTQLMILPLPCGGTVTPKTALAWLRDEFPHFHTAMYNVAALGPTQDIRDAANFLGIDLATAHEACVRAITTRTSQSFEQDQSLGDWDYYILSLAKMGAGRQVMNGSEGGFEWAFDELAEELVRRLKSHGNEGAPL